MSPKGQAPGMREHPPTTPPRPTPPDTQADPSTPEAKPSAPEENEPVNPHEADRKKKKKGKEKEKTGSSRGVETMFRTSYRTHLDLSALADNKANIMISINGIIMSILLASVAPQIAYSRILLLPMAVLLVFCLLSLVYAVLAARPRVTRRETSLEEVRAGKANILFFGNFISMDEEDFVLGMEELMKDPGRTYGNMTRDIYGLGSVLETKYRLLRTSYTLFMFGLVLGVLLFLAAYTWTSGNAAGI